MPLPRRLLGLAVAAGLVSSPAFAQPCIPQAQAESLFLALAPSLVGTVAATCATRLPPRALLRTRVGPLTDKYAAVSERAWPQAKDALKQLAGPDAGQLLDSDMARPMILSLVAPLLAKEIKPSSCGDIDRVLTLIDPLPARNTAALIVTIVELAQRGKPTRPGSIALSICPPAGTRP